MTARSRVLGGLGSVLIFAAFLVCWELLVEIRDIKKFVLPSPTQIWDDFWRKPDVFVRYGFNTLEEAVGGLVIGVVAGSAVAVVAHRYATVRRSVRVYSAALMALPIVAVVPLANVFFGPEPKSRIFVVALTVTPIITVFVLNGLRSIDPGVVEVFHSVAASRVKVLTGLHVPSTLPHLVSGVRVAGPTSFAVAVLAEYFGGRLNTLGTFMKASSTLLKVGDLWGAALMAFVFSTALYAAIALFERRLLAWHPANRRGNR